MATWVNIMDVIYPVGSVYLNKSSISPASTIGGTWSQVKGGCLAATGYEGYASAGEWGGTFAISINQLPSHTHYFDSLHRYTATSSAAAAVGSGIAAGYDTGQTNAYHTTFVGGGKLFILAIMPCTFGSEQLSWWL